MSSRHPQDKFITLPTKKISELSAVAFDAKVKGKIIKCLLIKKEGRFFAYQNLCKHLPVTLDLNDANFFTHDKAHLQCHMHGAMYEVETGFCVAGPCQGARLVALDVKEEEGRVVVRIPETLVED